MASSRHVRPGLPRLYQDHRQVEGVVHRAYYEAYEQEFGPLQGLLRLEAWRIAGLAVEVQMASQALAHARRVARDGKGRRPNARAIERLARRAGLANVTYTQNLDRLRELAAKNGHRAPRAILAAADRAFREDRP